MNNNKNLINGNVLSVLVKFTLPILFSILLQTAYGSADLFIVGQFSDVNNISGVSVGSQISQIFMSACLGISMGTTVLIGRFIGSGEKERASKVVGTSVFAFAIMAVISTAIIIIFATHLIKLMQTPSESFSQAKSYLVISGIGSIFIVGYNLLGSVFRGIGDSKTPLIAPQAFGQALSAFAAQNLDANKPERADKGLLYAIIISLIYGAFSGYISFFHGEIFTNFFNADTATTLGSLEYMKAYSVDCMLVAFMFNLHGYFNGWGKTKFVMYNSVLSAFLIRIPVSYYFSTFENPSLFLIGIAIPVSTVVQIIAGFIYLKKVKNERFE